MRFVAGTLAMVFVGLLAIYPVAAQQAGGGGHAGGGPGGGGGTSGGVGGQGAGGGTQGGPSGGEHGAGPASVNPNGTGPGSVPPAPDGAPVQRNDPATAFGSDTNADADVVRDAVASGRSVPFPQVLASVESLHPGQIVAVRIARNARSGFSYVVKVLTDEGTLRQVTVDARSGGISADR